LALTQHGIHSGSRTLEAPRGNRYAPARGLLVMMMMVILTSNKLRLSAVQLLYSKTVLTESACRCLFDTFCRYRLVLVGRARLAWASIWVPINRSEPSLHLGLLLPYQVCISLLLLFTLMIMHSSRGVTSYLNCCMPHRRGGGLPARLTGNVSRHLSQLVEDSDANLFDNIWYNPSPRSTSSFARQERLHIQSSTFAGILSR